MAILSKLFQNDNFLDSVVVTELDTIPMELWEELEKQLNSQPITEEDFWGNTDVAPL